MTAETETLRIFGVEMKAHFQEGDALHGRAGGKNEWLSVGEGPKTACRCCEGCTCGPSRVAILTLRVPGDSVMICSDGKTTEDALAALYYKFTALKAFVNGVDDTRPGWLDPSDIAP